MENKMHFVGDPILEFWAKSFGVSLSEMNSGEFKVVTSGAYIDRYGDGYIYLFKDLQSGKSILAGSLKNISQIQKPTLLVDSIPGFQKAFDDVDYLLAGRESFLPAPCFATTKKLKTQTDLEDFYSKISEEDRDTLDLTFKNETAFGLYVEKSLVGVSRYAPLKDEPRVADITIVLDAAFRGQGYGLQLASVLILDLLGQGLCPRYRVNRDLLASTAIAKRLGFTERFRVQTFSPMA